MLLIVHILSKVGINWLITSKNLGNLKQCVNPLWRIVLVFSFRITSKITNFDLAE